MGYRKGILRQVLEMGITVENCQSMLQCDLPKKYCQLTTTAIYDGIL